VNHFSGLGLLRGAGLVTGLQVGFLLIREWAVYLGPEISYTLFSGAGLLETLATLWIDIPIPSTHSVKISLGGAGGLAFPRDLIGVRTPAPTAYGEIVVSQDINDLATLRGQIRPGIVAGESMFMVNLNLLFRFY